MDKFVIVIPCEYLPEIPTEIMCAASFIARTGSDCEIIKDRYGIGHRVTDVFPQLCEAFDNPSPDAFENRYLSSGNKDDYTIPEWPDTITRTITPTPCPDYINIDLQHDDKDE